VEREELSRTRSHREGEKAIGLRVAGWAEASLVDVIGDVAFTIWFNYCDFRCPWCQNAHVVLARESREISVGELLEAISDALLLIGYVQATGGEPTLQDEALEALFRACRELGVRTSLDTNGSRPEVIGRLLDKDLLDHVALDVKAPLSEPEKYGRVIGLPSRGREMAEKVRASVQEVIEKAPYLEVRTTFVPTLLTPEDVLAIAGELVEMGLAEHERYVYVLQQFVPSETLIDPSFADVERPSPEFLLELAARVKKEAGLAEVYVRAQELGVAKAGLIMRL